VTVHTASATETEKSRTEEVFGVLPADSLVVFSPETPGEDLGDAGELFADMLEPA
jgi:hypothetical protein